MGIEFFVAVLSLLPCFTGSTPIFSLSFHLAAETPTCYCMLFTFLTKAFNLPITSNSLKVLTSVSYMTGSDCFFYGFSCLVIFVES